MVDLQMRVENERRGRLLLVQPLQQAVDQRSLARAYFAGKQNEALAGLNSICQIVQRLPGLWRQEQVAGIRVDVEGIFAESEELFVHGRVVKSVAELSAV